MNAPSNKFREENACQEDRKRQALLKPGMLIGYARISTQDQNLELQTEALQKAGCKKIFEDRMSGSRAERHGLAQSRESLRAGDTLVIWKLDRLGRGVRHIIDLVGNFNNTESSSKA